jgi:hypothetical protein
MKFLVEINDEKLQQYLKDCHLEGNAPPEDILNGLIKQSFKPMTTLENHDITVTHLANFLSKAEFIQKIDPVKVGEYHKGQEVTEVLIDELYENYKGSKQYFDDWVENFMKQCYSCDSDCSRCHKPLYP